jgi:tetratricopeptide (TPR) repeat protein
LAIADQLFRANSLVAAVRSTQLDPNNARYFTSLAEHQEAEGMDPKPALAAASRLNPLDSSVWIRRGLRAEFEGNFAQAESFLLAAARVDKLFDPRATLANYYFRRNNPEPFWRWTREALAIHYGDLTSLFRLCWRVSDDPEFIRSRALPPDREVLRAYVRFLLDENRLDAAEPIARQLAGAATTDDAAVLLDFVDRRLALPVWNSLCARNVIPFSAVALDHPITNADFRVAPTSRGFDWRVPPGPDIVAERASPSGLRIDLSGKEPEQCELLAQIVPLSPGKTCRLRFSYLTSGFPAESGLRWRILSAASPFLSSEDWQQRELTFSTGDATHARLSLAYSRVVGTSRLEGSITLRDIQMECAP